MQQKCHGKVNASGCTAVPVRDGQGYHSKNPQGALTVRRLVQSGASDPYAALSVRCDGVGPGRALPFGGFDGDSSRLDLRAPPLSEAW